MHTYHGVERRQRALEGWSFFVEIGVNYFRTVSEDKAVDFMRSSGVASDIIARVTAPHGLRRRTRWEMHVDEAALRQALGARPLLEKNSKSAPAMERAA